MGSDGAIELISVRSTKTGREVISSRTTDNGDTWSEPGQVFALPPGGFGTPLPLTTANGQRQFFWLLARGSGRRPGIDYFIDIWNAHSIRNPAGWTKPRVVFQGYVGSVNGMTQLSTGRIVVPFARWVGGRPSGPPTGSNVTTTIFSDDDGATWNCSTAALTAPCTANYNGSNYGACEPTILELADGRVWMLIRTQTGWLYESFSRDGDQWSEPSPSRFRSSNSPAWLVRLPDRRIVVLWNNCENTSRVDGQGVYTNRDSLHAAISSDEAATWRGYREVSRDPLRNEPPPKRGDRGTAYPYAVATRDNMILCVTGQGSGRRNLLRIDPQWLEQKHAMEDFSTGLEAWSVFTAFEPPVRWWRNRKRGAVLVPHPTRDGARCLHLRRADSHPADGAVWNFPSGQIGTLNLSLMAKPGSTGAALALADRFIQPTDHVGLRRAIFELKIDADGKLPFERSLEAGCWHDIQLAWDLHARQCRVTIDGQLTGRLALMNEPTAGISYLHLRSTAESPDPAGLLVERVEVKVSSQSP